MNRLEDYAIKKVAKGGFYIFLGMAISAITFFLYKILAARYLGPADYGLLTLGIIILNIATIFGLAGIHHSIGMLINYYFAEKDYSKIKGLFISSFSITMLLSIIIAAFIYRFSSSISIRIFGMPELSRILFVFSIAVPFSAITQLLKYYFYAFKQPQLAIISESFFEKTLNLVFLILAIMLSADVYAISWGYAASLLISSIAGFYIFNRQQRNFTKKKVNAEYEIKNMLAFSTPLMITGVMSVAIAWTDTLFIGIFKSQADVGIYNAAYVIASSLMIFWLSFGDIFYPVISELHAKKLINPIRKTFETATRWVFALIVPISIVSLLYPKRILSLAFGSLYAQASIPLVILIIGYFFTAFFGLAEHGLRTFKKTKFLGIWSTIGFLINIALNIILIPLYGITGAAIATTITLLAVNIVKFIYFRRILKFGFNKKIYAKYIMSALISFLIVFSAVKLTGLDDTFYFMSAIIIYLIIYAFISIMLKSFTEDDIEVLDSIERKIGIKFTLIKNLVRK